MPHRAARTAIIIPARDEARHIGACLESIRAQGEVPGGLETIVIDDGSRDETGAIARAAGATVLRTGGVGPSRGRNLAVQQTEAELCFFTDADCELQPGCLATLLAALDGAGAGFAGAGGRQAAPPSDGAYARLVQLFLEGTGFVSDYARIDLQPTETTHNPSCSALLRRAALLEVGGFREGLWPCEDVDLDLRLRQRGHRLLYVPAAVVLHHRAADPAAFRRMMRGYGRGHAALIKLHGPSRLMHAMPALTAVTLGAAPAAAVLSAPLWLRARLGERVAGQTTVVSRMLALALWHWHLGFVEGLAGRSAIAPPA